VTLICWVIALVILFVFRRAQDDKAGDDGENGGVALCAMKCGLRRVVADGGIAQLVEHYAGSVRVRSSSLLASTNERSFLRAFSLSGTRRMTAHRCQGLQKRGSGRIAA
jgi:hypothetical protein